VSDLLAVLEVERLDVRLILTNIWNRIAFFTHPFINIGGVAIFGDPNLGEYSAKFSAGIGFLASKFEFDIVFFRFDGFEAPLFQFLFAE
jgi:hypothetical protein